MRIIIEDDSTDRRPFTQGPDNYEKLVDDVLKALERLDHRNDKLEEHIKEMVAHLKVIKGRIWHLESLTADETPDLHTDL